MPHRLQFHVDHQRQAAFEAARLLRTLDPAVRAAVLKHYRNADLDGSKARIERAIRGYADGLFKAAGPTS